MSDTIFVILVIILFCRFISKDYRLKKRKQEEYRQEYEQNLRIQEEYRRKNVQRLREQKEHERQIEQRKIEELINQRELERQEEQKIDEYILKWKQNLRIKANNILNKHEVDNYIKTRINNIVNKEIYNTIEYSLNTRFHKLKLIDVEKICTENSKHIMSIVLENIYRFKDNNNNKYYSNNNSNSSYKRCIGICSDCRRDECIENRNYKNQ